MQSTATHTHRYQKVKQYILDGIRQQSWRASEKIPSENELVTLCNVSRMTARKALEELAREDILERVHGLGTFVKPQKISSSFLEIKDITEEIIARGKQHSSRLLALELRQSVPLEIINNTLTDCFYSEILHFENKVPIQFEVRHVNPAIAPEYLQQNFVQVTPAHYLLKTAAVTKLEQVVEACVATAYISELLQMQTAEPCLLINRNTWSGENWATCSRFYHPGNSFRLKAEK